MVRLALLRDWNAAELETARLKPRGAAAALLVWETAEGAEGGPDPALSAVLARGLEALGPVAFRWKGQMPRGCRAMGPLAGGRRSQGRGWVAAGAEAEGASAALFGLGWADGAQAALVGGDAARSCGMLAVPDFSRHALMPDEVLFAAVVDGVGGLLAAPTPAALEKAEGALLGALAAAGYQVAK